MPIISLSYDLYLAASFVAGQYELFLSSISTSFLWKCHLLLCIMGNPQVLSCITGQLPISGDAICYSARGAVSGKVICYCVI